MTELLDLAALVVLGLLLAAFAVLLFVAILFNARAGERYRKRLAQRLDGLRLGRMLSLLGIDSNAYLHQQRVLDIHHHMNRCDHCARTETCDERLASGKLSPEALDFCDNEAALKALAEEQGKAGGPGQDAR